MISEGAPVNALDKHKTTALINACYFEHAEIIHILLNHGADPNIQDKKKISAIHFACYKQMTVGVELLLACGADHSPQDLHLCLVLLVLESIAQWIHYSSHAALS